MRAISFLALLALLGVATADNAVDVEVVQGGENTDGLAGEDGTPPADVDAPEDVPAVKRASRARGLKMDAEADRKADEATALLSERLTNKVSQLREKLRDVEMTVMHHHMHGGAAEQLEDLTKYTQLLTKVGTVQKPICAQVRKQAQGYNMEREREEINRERERFHAAPDHHDDKAFERELEYREERMHAREQHSHQLHEAERLCEEITMDVERQREIVAERVVEAKRMAEQEKAHEEERQKERAKLFDIDFEDDKAL